MRVIINEREYDYFPDYPDGWLFSSGDYFKFPVLIGNTSCFIKRFVTRRSQDVPGWALLTNLKYKNEPNLPRIYDIASVEENRKQVYYVFYEFLKGTTLEAAIAQGKPLDVGRLTNDLFHALGSVHKYNYWFADFCEKNIFYEDTGRHLLMDLDSCQPATQAPDNDMQVNMVYWALVFKFYKEILDIKELSLSDIPGICLNYLQTIFLVLQIKLFSLGEQQEYLSTEAFNDLPAALDRRDPAFRALFIKVLNVGKKFQYLQEASEIKDLIIKKIVEQDERLSSTGHPSVPTTIVDPGASSVSAEPVIIEFKPNSFVIEKGESIVLNWELKNAHRIELNKNGLPFKKLTADKKGITIFEPYDGRDKEVLYTLIVYNDKGQISSQSLIISIKDSVIKSTGTGNKAPGRSLGKRKGVWIASLALLSAILVALATFMNTRKENHVFIYNFAPKNVLEESTIVISGKNFPEDANGLQVFFNNLNGAIQFNSPNLISVTVPQMGKNIGTAIVKVAVVVRGDTTYASKELLVREKK